MTPALWMWRGAKWLSLLCGMGLIALVIGLAQGGADLPHHALRVHDGSGFPPTLDGDPLTVQVSASTRDPDQPWGIDVGPVRFLVHPHGYVFVGQGVVAWREFPHVRRSQNELYVHTDEGGAVFYVNRERVTRLPPLGPVTVTLVDAPDGLINLWTTVWQPG